MFLIVARWSFKLFEYRFIYLFTSGSYHDVLFLKHYVLRNYQRRHANQLTSANLKVQFFLVSDNVINDYFLKSTIFDYGREFLALICITVINSRLLSIWLVDIHWLQSILKFFLKNSHYLTIDRTSFSGKVTCFSLPFN